MSKSDVRKRSYNVTFRVYRIEDGICNEFNVKRHFDNIFHLKYYLEHYKDSYKETFNIIEVLKKEVCYDY